jgi:hypothetical protein
MTEHDNTFLLPDAQDTTYQLTVEDRIKVLKQEGEGLVEHSKRLQQDRQRLMKDFEAKMKDYRAKQMDLEDLLEYFRTKQEVLRKYEVELTGYLKDH